MGEKETPPNDIRVRHSQRRSQGATNQIESSELVKDPLYPGPIQKFRAFIHDTFDKPESGLFARFIQILILCCISASVAILVFETQPSVQRDPTVGFCTKAHGHGVDKL